MIISGLNMDLNDRDSWVGIIGTRNPTTDEIYATNELVIYLVSKGYIIVSGLARGIDAQAHKSAIHNDGKTIAIVNTPKGQNIYPDENRALAEDIKRDGCILYPFESRAIENGWGNKGMNQFKRRLIERDIILAKMCNKVVAISDKEIIEGGTRWAIQYGIQFGKEVYRFDSSKHFHKNPKTAICNIDWQMEYNLSNLN